jgi:hypothetical protein
MVETFGTRGRFQEIERQLFSDGDYRKVNQDIAEDDYSNVFHEYEEPGMKILLAEREHEDVYEHMGTVLPTNLVDSVERTLSDIPGIESLDYEIAFFDYTDGSEPEAIVTSEQGLKKACEMLKAGTGNLVEENLAPSV